MVTGEKNSPTAAYASHKRQLKWVPGSRGEWLDHPAPEVISTGTGPPSWWLDDRLTTCHHNKVNCKEIQTVASEQSE